MTFRALILLNLNKLIFKASFVLLGLELLNAFDYLIRINSLAFATVKKNRYAWPTKIVYNNNYNPHKPFPNISCDNYLSYDAKELLYNNRPIIVLYFLKGYTVADAAKKPWTL
jgi:hypothetical protein